MNGTSVRLASPDLLGVTEQPRMKLLDKKITIDELAQISQRMFGTLVKAVVDVDKEIMVIDAELHSDQEAFLLESGSEQDNLWGINLYPAYANDEN